MRRAGAGDAEALRAFLLARRDESMFLLSNLDASTGAMWLAEGAGGVEGALMLSPGGYLLPQWPGAAWARARGALAGLEVVGAVGPAAQVRPLLAALGLDALPTRHDADEEAFALDLADLRVPPGATALRRPDEGDRALLRRWRAAYKAEAFGLPPAEAAASAAREVDAALAVPGERFVLLLDGNAPVAMTGFNARVGDQVGVGGVYTPPPLRGRGHARRAVALHLRDARARGVARAVLSASGPAAARAYRAIGFRRAGTTAIVELRDPATLRG